MPAFGKKSAEKLAQCDTRIVKVMEQIIKHVDCTILEGIRSKDQQNEYFRTGRSKVQWPNSKHNIENPGDLSKAIDVIMYPIEWDNWDKNRWFVGYVMGVADSMGVNLRSGLDWDGDHDFKDQTFNDAPHFELKD